MTYIVGDIHEVIKEIEDNSISLIYTNPPFGTTNKDWDKPLNWNLLFPEMFRILKDDGVICLHCSTPFTYDLIRHKKPNYHYVWCKARPTNHLNAKKQPLRNMEEILVYYKNPQHTYNIQMKGDKITKSKRENKNHSGYYKAQKAYESEHKGNYPTTFLGVFKSISQKDSPKSVPDLLTKYIMLTYSNKNDVILDMTCCDMNNGNIATDLEREYIGIDKSDDYFYKK
jgi:DNA modification methylase